MTGKQGSSPESIVREYFVIMEKGKTHKYLYQ